MRWYVWVGLVLVAALGWGGYKALYFANKMSIASDPESIAAIQLQTKAQNESGFYRPEKRGLDAQPRNPLNNVYFGDLHVHTAESVDAYLFGVRMDMDTAYRVAKGEGATLRTGERIALTQPLDFAALTDHAEGFGRLTACAQGGLDKIARTACERFENPSLRNFLEMRSQTLKRPLVRDLALFGNDSARERSLAANTWQSVQAAADRHYEPGRFTTFAGYEYSPTLPDRGKHHRNIIFRSSQTPTYAISAYDAASEIDLWKQLEATCTDDCQFLTIPHSANRTWGLAFASKTIDGIAYTDADWQLRERNEPLVEMFQNKGNSECSVSFGAGDEECGFEQFLPLCKQAGDTVCLYPTSMVRDGLQKGLSLEQELGINPLQFGLIGATDTHNANPGNTEEWSFRGVADLASSPAARRVDDYDPTGLKKTNPGGLAAVWAPENTREALFDAMKRKEVYATSGTRIRLRVFAGFNLPTNLSETGDFKSAYDTGVPMGGALVGKNAPISLFVWASRDPDSAPLSKVQVIKGWLENGQRQEKVYDIACGGSSLDPQSGRCESNGAKVNLSNCSWTQNTGAAQLKTLWQDPDYEAGENAFYYVRVVENPTCRWSTYDSLRLGRQPPKDIPATVTEMAWGSPIWVKPQK